MKTTLNALAMASILSMLAACGGGGSEETEPVAAPSPAPAPSGDTTINSQIPSSTYPAGSEELAAFNLLNAERIRCGFGALQQSAQLDQAALAHADWMLINNIYSHEENASYPVGYTGTHSWDRASYAGYSWTDTVEVIGFGDTGSKAGRGSKSVRELLSTVYHGYGSLLPMKDVGISVREPADVGSSTLIVPTEVLAATTDTHQLLSESEVVTYPCEGTTGTEYQLKEESPNPVPGRNLTTSPLGHNVTVMVRHGQNLTLTSAQMQRVSDGANVVLRAPVTGAGDPNGMLTYLPHVGYVLPDEPLQQNSSYRVTITGTNNGVAFSRTFTFTTGS